MISRLLKHHTRYEYGAEYGRNMVYLKKTTFYIKYEN